MLIDSSLHSEPSVMLTCSVDDVQKRTAGDSRTSLLALCEHEIGRARERERARPRPTVEAKEEKKRLPK